MKTNNHSTTTAKKIQVFIKCPGCDKEINRTKDLDSMELAEKIKFDALLDPMIGWCNDCDRKPLPFIEADGKIIEKENK